ISLAQDDGQQRLMASRNLPLEYGVQAAEITIPLLRPDGGPIGALILASPDDYGFDDEQHQLLAGIGNQFVVALERAELHENQEKRVAERTAQVERLNRLYSLLSGINSAIVRIHDAAELFDEACRIAVSEGRFVRAWIGMADPAERAFQPLASAETEAAP